MVLSAWVPCHPNKNKKIRIGCLDRSGGKFKQVRFKDGGGIREFVVNEGDDTTMSSLKETGYSFHQVKAYVNCCLL